MAFSRRNHEKQVRLTVFDNEPIARLAEQRLRQAGIPSFIRSLRGGPGLWGSAYNLPHDIYVYASDVDQARQLLELAPSSPEDEVVERGQARDGPEDMARDRRGAAGNPGLGPGGLAVQPRRLRRLSRGDLPVFQPVSTSRQPVSPRR